MDLMKTCGYVAGFHDTLSLRELGGQRATDGRSVRHGLFYRGSALTGLTEAERARVDGFGLRFILDLRAPDEVGERHDYVPGGVEYLCVAGMYDAEGREVDFSPESIARLMEQAEGGPDGLMTTLYASMAFGNPALHALVGHMEAGQVPLYFHCSAGKDRTGVSAALILMLLGVPDAAIMAEYLLTNEYRASIIHAAPDELPAWLSDDQRTNWAQINSVCADDLQAFLDAIDGRYTTREAYFAAEYGIDGAELNELRDRYLE